MISEVSIGTIIVTIPLEHDIFRMTIPLENELTIHDDFWGVCYLLCLCRSMCHCVMIMMLLSSLVLGIAVIMLLFCLLWCVNYCLCYVWVVRTPAELWYHGSVRKGDDTVGNTHRAQIHKFELFVLILFLKVDRQLSIDQFEQTVSQSTVSSPLWSVVDHWCCGCLQM